MNVHRLFHPHLYPPLEGLPSPIEGEGFMESVLTIVRPLLTQNEDICFP